MWARRLEEITGGDFTIKNQAAKSLGLHYRHCGASVSLSNSIGS
jgi:hypothetical protein